MSTWALWDSKLKWMLHIAEGGASRSAKALSALLPFESNKVLEPRLSESYSRFRLCSAPPDRATVYLVSVKSDSVTKGVPYRFNPCHSFTVEMGNLIDVTTCKKNIFSFFFNSVIFIDIGWYVQCFQLEMITAYLVLKIW